MNITITTNEGKKYDLTYTRRSVKIMSENGFRTSNIETNPIEGAFDFFSGAFLANHRYMKRDEIQEVWDSIGDKKGLLDALTAAYAEPINTFFDDAEDEKKSQWEIVK